MTDIFKGATSNSVFIELVDSTTGLPKTGIVYTDVTGSYVRTRSARVAITMATLASASASFSSGGFILVDDTNQPGVYRVDVPDAAFATGVTAVVVTVKATECRTVSRLFNLVDVNNQVAYAPNVAAGGVGGLLTAPTTANTGLANVTQFGGINLTSSSGIPEVKVASMADNTLTAAAIAADAGAEIAALVETYIVNEGDATAVMQAIANLIAADWVAGDASPLAIAAAVRTNLATELARIDAAISTRLATAGYTAPATPTNVSDAQAAILAKLPAALEGGRIAAALDSASVAAVQSGLATSASITNLRGADNDTLKTLSDQIDGISSGGTDWTANERTAIRSILGVPVSGTTPADPTVGILDTIRDSVGTYIAGISAVASTTTGTIVGFPSSLNIGDSYTEEANSDIHVFIRDENDDPITAVGDFSFTDPEFAPEVNITQSGSTGRVKAVVTFVDASPEDYLKVEIPTSQSRRASPGTATIQCLLKWVDTDGKVLAQKTLSKQAVTWNEMI